MFDEAEIQNVCGVIETNGFEVPELNLVALYGHGYLLEHSCIPNTTRTFDARLHLVVTASLDIKAGEHITTSYIDPLCGERIRTVHLLKFKHFTCTCPRCLDPTDLGTHLSSVKCKFCSEGFLIPSRDIAIPWKCNCCAGHSEAQQVEETLVELFKLKENLSPTTAALERYLRETSQWLSENHHFRLEVKLALLQMYGRGREEAKISEEDIRRKRHLCEQVLEVANVVVPGIVIIVSQWLSASEIPKDICHLNEDIFFFCFLNSSKISFILIILFHSLLFKLIEKDFLVHFSF